MPQKCYVQHRQRTLWHYDTIVPPSYFKPIPAGYFTMIQYLGQIIDFHSML